MMRSYLRLKLYTTTIFLVFALSSIYTIPAYADGETPPVETPTATEPSESPDQDETTEEASAETSQDQTQAEPAPVIEEVLPSQSVESILAEVPQDTEVIVLNEEGETVPLVTEEAAETIVEGDPQWCPVGVTPGSPTCTPARNTFSDMLNDLSALNSGLGPNMAGVIWIHEDYNSSTADGIVDDSVPSLTLNGSTLTNMASFALTIQGGWTGTGKTIDITNPSEFVGLTLNILNWENTVTLSDITIENSTTGAAYALTVTTTGNIVATRVVIKNNTEGGAGLDNANVGSTGNVTVTDSEFSNNGGGSGGLVILSNGTVTLKNVTANNNTSGRGIYILNHNVPIAKNVTLTNITVNNNNNLGLFVNSKGLITGTDITAVNNNNDGVQFTNIAGTAGVTLTGTNLFFSNNGYGLHILSNGAIKLNNIHAIDNGLTGAQIDNDSAATPQAVTLTGSNSFKFNGGAGLLINSLGQIKLNNITASSNTSSVGAYLYNYTGPATSGVTLTGTNTFNDNDIHGLYIQSAGAVTVNAITANGNGTASGDGLYIDNSWGSLFKGVTLTGVNTFNNNKSEGLQIISEGIVILNNLNASGNTGYGVIVNNTSSTPASPKAVTLNGTNIINNNSGYGLYIQSHGAITTNNITANFNGIANSNGYGAYLDNFMTGATITPANVTLNGVNNFNGNYNEGLEIQSLGAIKANTVTANDSVNGDGASFNNNFGTSTNGVTLTGTNTFTGNDNNNLSVYSNGVISLSNITASNSVSNSGAIIVNSNAATPKAVTLSGTNDFSGNWFNGLNINSDGAITTNNLSANGNGTSGTSGFGASFNNTILVKPNGVTLTGNNSFNDNYGTGLQIGTNGNIKGNNLTANGSVTSYGAYLDNSNPASIGGVTLTGTNNFNDNNLTNLEIYTLGAITINNLTASGSNTALGAYLSHSAASIKPVTLTGTNIFNDNANTGLYVSVYGAITTNNLYASGNGTSGTGHGVYLSNESASTPAGITMNGNNVFTANDDFNVNVRSKGAIKANNVSANGSVSSFGAGFNNADFIGAVGNVSLTGVNTFSNNFNRGLSIASKGMITINNVTASNNGSDGVQLDNTSSGFATPKSVTITGYLTANNNTNGGYGFEVYSYGAVITNNITANGNAAYGAYIDNDENNAMVSSNVTMNGTNKFNGNNNTGLVIYTLGSIIANNVTSTTSATGIGADFNASNTGAIGAVTLMGTNTFSGNTGYGLNINVNGAVTLNNVNANGNAVGVYINNAYAGTSAPKTVKLTGTNSFNNNNGNGLQIITYGAVSTNNLTANDNNNYGAYLNNLGAATAANVSMTGTNQFNGNNNSGLNVNSKGSIAVNNLTANDNTQQGASLNNNTGASTTTVNLTGVNTFIGNGAEGLIIIALGTVNLTKVTGDDNGEGVHVNTDGNINFTCGSVTNNNTYGWYLFTTGITTVKGVVAAGNTPNTFHNVAGTLIQSIACPLP